MAAVIMPMLLSGGLIGGATKAAGLTGKTKLMTDATLNLGVDALISGTSDTTSDPGNLASFNESDSEHSTWCDYSLGITRLVILLMLSTGRTWLRTWFLVVLILLSLLFTEVRAGNKIIPKNDVAQRLSRLNLNHLHRWDRLFNKALDKKQAEQLKIGQEY